MKTRLPLLLSSIIFLLAAQHVYADDLKGVGRIYFLSLGTFPTDTVNQLARYFGTKYGISIETLPVLDLNEQVVDPKRQQLVAEEVIGLIKAGHAALASDPQAVLIALTEQDMYIRSYKWRFSFSFRENDRFAVISRARMRIGVMGNILPADAALVDARLKKIIAKNIGIMYYHLPQSQDPRSVLYDSILGLDDLDRMGEEFFPGNIVTEERSLLMKPYPASHLRFCDSILPIPASSVIADQLALLGSARRFLYSQNGIPTTSAIPGIKRP